MENQTLRVLFIGNSHTYFNDMPYLFQQLAQWASGAAVEVVMLAQGGWSLGQHLDKEERFNIRYGRYDYIVLQQVTHPFPGAEALLEQAGALGEWIAHTGARTVGYMTWAQQDRPEDQACLTQAFRALAREQDAILAPVGLAFQALREGGIDLYDADGCHASPAGSYLAACVLVAAILGEDPTGLPGRIAWQDEILCDLEEETARRLQRVAWQTVEAEHDE